MKKLLTVLFFVLLAGLFIWPVSPQAMMVLENNLPVIYFWGGSSKVITKVQFNPEAEISVAYGLGNWKVASLPKLSSDEGRGEKLIVATLSHNLSLPVKSRSWGDRLKWLIVTVRLGEKRETVLLDRLLSDEANNLYLKTKSLGFTKSPALNVNLVYKAYSSQVLERTKKLIEGLGLNVVYIKKDDLDKELDCRVTGPKKAITFWVENTFPTCQFVFDDSEILTFELGEKYAQAF